MTGSPFSRSRTSTPVTLPDLASHLRRELSDLVSVPGTVCIYRALMRARDLEVPRGAGAEYGLAAGLVEVGAS